MKSDVIVSDGPASAPPRAPSTLHSSLLIPRGWRFYTDMNTGESLINFLLLLLLEKWFWKTQPIPSNSSAASELLNQYWLSLLCDDPTCPAHCQYEDLSWNRFFLLRPKNKYASSFFSEVFLSLRSRSSGYMACSNEDSSKLLVSCLVAKSHLTLLRPPDCSPSGFSIHGIFQTSMLEWVAISVEN